MHPPPLKLLQQLPPRLPTPIIRIIDNHLPSLLGKKVPNLVLNPILDLLPQRQCLWRLSVGEEIVGRDVGRAAEDFAPVVAEGVDTGFDS